MLSSSADMMLQKPPIFVIGNPRSGTTLLRLMLTCHKNIVIPPECGFAVWYYQKYQDWEQRGYSELLLGRFIDDLMQARKIEHWQLDSRDLLAFLQRKRPGSYPELVSLVYVWYGISQRREFKRWGDKNNFYLHHIPTIRAMFPDAYFAHIVRDGRDVACSYKHLAARQIRSSYAPRLPHRIDEIAEEWKSNIRTVSQSLSSANRDKVCEVRFEGLVLAPEATLRELCTKLGEDYDPGMLEYHLRNRQLALEPVEFLAWKSKSCEPLNEAEVARYRTQLSHQEIEIFESIAGEELARYGYLGEKLAGWCEQDKPR